MKEIDWSDARVRLRDICASREFIDSIHFFYCKCKTIDKRIIHYVDECIIDYIEKLLYAGLSFEQIMTMLSNATGTTGIFDVRCFFAELGPKAKKFGFTKKRIASDIQDFISDMEIYKHELIPMRTVQDLFSNPEVAKDNLHKITDLCSDGHGKYYRAAIEAAIWHMIGHKTADDAVAHIKPFMKADGFDILGLLQETTTPVFDFDKEIPSADYKYPLELLAWAMSEPSK